ncbi:MAG: flagellar FlbD family protein [Chitinivibrionales bacterium]|nr:flagellar FlbD family protein [Chitinivibrionales bacterium]
MFITPKGVTTLVIALQKLNGTPFVLNADLIETIEATPDTIIKLTTGKTIVSRTSVEEVVRKIIKYKQLCHCTIQVVEHQAKPIDTEGQSGDEGDTRKSA